MGTLLLSLWLPRTPENCLELMRQSLYHCEHPAWGQVPCPCQSQEFDQTFRRTVIWKYVSYMVLKIIVTQPIWFCRVFKAVILVLFGHPGNLLLVTVGPKQLICFLLVECAAHTTVCGVHWEYARAIYLVPLPLTTFYQSLKSILVCWTSLLIWTYLN